jgi:uncharacterized protein YkwD
MKVGMMAYGRSARAVRQAARWRLRTMPAMFRNVLATSLALFGLAVHAADECQPAAEAALRALNALRAEAQSCGAAVPALNWDPRLAESARLYAQELARREVLTHEGQHIRSLRERLRGQGYPFRLAGENLAAGPASLDEVLAQWLGSPAHCKNVMSAGFADAGLACALDAGKAKPFWVLHLGRGLDPAQVDRP